MIGKLTLPMFAFAVLAMICTVAPAQTTKPAPIAPVTLGEMRLRANQSLANNDYATALPILEKVALQLSDQPDDLGPVMEQIRVCKRQIAKAAAPKPLPSVVAANTARVPHPALAKDQVLDIPIKDLGNFDYDAEKGGNIPEDVQKLEGAHFRTHGFMIPLDQAESISEFVLVPSLFACCFGQPPQIQHTVIIHCPKGKAVSYFPDELVVDGTLHVREKKDDGFIVSIFDLDASSVKPAAQ